MPAPRQRELREKQQAEQEKLRREQEETAARLRAQQLQRKKEQEEAAAKRKAQEEAEALAKAVELMQKKKAAEARAAEVRSPPQPGAIRVAQRRSLQRVGQHPSHPVAGSAWARIGSGAPDRVACKRLLFECALLRCVWSFRGRSQGKDWCFPN